MRDDGVAAVVVDDPAEAVAEQVRVGVLPAREAFERQRNLDLVRLAQRGGGEELLPLPRAARRLEAQPARQVAGAYSPAAWSSIRTSVDAARPA